MSSNQNIFSAYTIDIYIDGFLFFLNQIHNNQLSQSNALGPMRLSSISSQDSGFTSQDTLFLPRPASPSSRNKV